MSIRSEGVGTVAVYIVGSHTAWEYNPVFVVDSHSSEMMSAKNHDKECEIETRIPLINQLCMTH